MVNATTIDIKYCERYQSMVTEGIWIEDIANYFMTKYGI